MDLFKAFKRLINDCKGEKSGKVQEALKEPESHKEAAMRGRSDASAEQPMPLGLQPAMIDMMSPSKLAVFEPTARTMQTPSYFGNSGRLPVSSMKENAKHSVSFEDASCSPRISASSPAGSASRFLSKNSNGTLKAASPLHTSGNQSTENARVNKITHEMSCNTKPEGQATIGRTKPCRVVCRNISLKNLLRLQSYSFISDVDCSEAQQAVDSSDSEGDENAHQKQSGEHLDNTDSSECVYSAAHFLLSPQNNMSSSIQHSSSSRIRGFSALSTAYDMSHMRLSRMSRGVVTQPAVSNSSAVSNGIACNDTSVLSSSNYDLIEEVLSPRQKEPKDSNVLAVSTALPHAMKRSTWSVKDYALSKQLHNGYASKVFSAQCTASGLKVVLKVYRLEKMDDLQRCQLFREVKIHSELQHHNIVQFYCAFKEENCVIIVQEFAAGGDLLRYMYRMGGRLTERAAAKLVLQPFLCALHYLHTQGIIHRDIKPENCLLTGDMVLQIADFGLAIDLKEERANTRAGTLDYMAPEILRCPTKQTPDQFKTAPGAAHYEMAADSWAVGAFAYELLCGKPPFRGSQMMETAHNIIRGDVFFPKDLSPGAVDFISSCLDPNPANRLTVIKMLNYPWIKMFERRKTCNNIQDGSAMAYQQDTVRVGHSPRIAVKTPGAMGRLALITARHVQPAASEAPDSPHDGQRIKQSGTLSRSCKH